MNPLSVINHYHLYICLILALLLHAKQKFDAIAVAEILPNTLYICGWIYEKGLPYTHLITTLAVNVKFGLIDKENCNLCAISVDNNL